MIRQSAREIAAAQIAEHIRAFFRKKVAARDFPQPAGDDMCQWRCSVLYLALKEMINSTGMLDSERVRDAAKKTVNAVDAQLSRPLSYLEEKS